MIPYSVKIIEQAEGNKTALIREVRFFGWLVKKEEVYTEGVESNRTIGFTALPDLKEYIDEDD